MSCCLEHEGIEGHMTMSLLPACTQFERGKGGREGGREGGRVGGGGEEEEEGFIQS